MHSVGFDMFVFAFSPISTFSYVATAAADGAVAVAVAFVTVAVVVFT